jgi:diguanylate cyclase (GGDEF)-like protein
MILFGVIFLVWMGYLSFKFWQERDYLLLGLSLLLVGVGLTIRLETTRILQEKIRAEAYLKETENRTQALYESEREQHHLAQALREIGFTLSATLSFDEVLNQILVQIGRIVPYDTASFLLVEDGKARVARQCGFDQFNPDLEKLVMSRVFDIRLVPNLKTMAEDYKPLIVADISRDPTWVGVEETRYVRSHIGMPVVFQGQIVAFIALEKIETGFYTQSHADLLTAFSGQAALAMQNACNYENVERQVREAEALRHTSSALLEAKDLDQVMEVTLTQLGHVIPYDSATIFLIEGDHMLLAATHHHQHASEIIGLTFSIDPICAEIKQTRRPLVLKDAQLDPRFNSWGETSHIHGWIGAPFLYRDELIGYLTIDSRKVGAYDEATARLVEVFANEAATAIQNARLFEEIQHMAITDPLTGLYDRYYFFKIADSEFQRIRRYSGMMSIIMIDLDDFKKVNDTFGHLAGDEVLRTLTRRCLGGLREVDTVARYGGEEFVILLPETGLAEAAQAADRILASISLESIDIGKHKIEISASFGVAELDEECVDIECLIGRADLALYAAKSAGRGQIICWQKDLENQKLPDGV